MREHPQVPPSKCQHAHLGVPSHPQSPFSPWLSLAPLSSSALNRPTTTIAARSFKFLKKGIATVHSQSQTYFLKSALRPSFSWVPPPCIQPAMLSKYFLKFASVRNIGKLSPSLFPEQCYLHSTGIVLSITSNLEMIKSVQEDMRRFCANTVPFYRGT